MEEGPATGSCSGVQKTVIGIFVQDFFFVGQNVAAIRLQKLDVLIPVWNKRIRRENKLEISKLPETFHIQRRGSFISFSSTWDWHDQRQHDERDPADEPHRHQVENNVQPEVEKYFDTIFFASIDVFKPPVSQHPVEPVEGGRRAQKVVAALVVQL